MYSCGVCEHSRCHVGGEAGAVSTGIKHCCFLDISTGTRSVLPYPLGGDVVTICPVPATEQVDFTIGRIGDSGGAFEGKRNRA